MKCPHCGGTVKKRSSPGSESHEDWRARLKLAFPDSDIEGEQVKMRRWILLHPGRQMTRRFVENWLHKADRWVPPLPPENEWQGITVGDQAAERREIEALRRKG